MDSLSVFGKFASKRSAGGWNTRSPLKKEIDKASRLCHRLQVEEVEEEGAGHAAVPALLVLALLGTAPQRHPRLLVMPFTQLLRLSRTGWCDWGL